MATSPNPNILLVEDDRDIRDSIQDLLEVEGYRVSTASNGKEAIEKLQSSPLPAVILLDLMMPVMNGWDFLENKKKDTRIADVPVIVVSAIADNTRVDSKAVRAFIKKPLDLDRVLEAVQGYCKAP